jgi:hypothetical protein
MRLRRGGPWTACRITCEAFDCGGLGCGSQPCSCGPSWQAWVNDIPQGPPNGDPWLVKGLERIWTGGEFVDETEYLHLRRLHEWAIKHAPWHPAAHPSETYNPGTARPRF